MKELSFKGFAVVLTGLIVYIGVIYAFNSSGRINSLPNVRYELGGNGHTLLRLQEAKKVKDIDILFIGSSQVYRGFDMRIFQEQGIKAFNLGTSSQTPFNTYFLLKKYLPRMVPKYVVMDLYWPMLSRDEVESVVDIISNSEINREVIEMAWESKNFVLLNCLLISGTNQLRSPLSPKHQKKLKQDIYVDGGFTQSLLTGNNIQESGLDSLNEVWFNPSALQLEYSDKVIQLCEERKIKLILTINPVTKELKEKVRNYEFYVSLIEKRAKKHGLHFIDYNNRLTLILSSQEDFLDKNHLSQSGVEKFNELFIEDLKRFEHVPTY